MPKLVIDKKEVEVEEGTTIIQACELAGIEIPRFCYHERLAIAGNCRMCLVEIEKSPKLVASCAMPVAEGMIVHTDSLKVKKARAGVMEFLLINHPLDCPICDQGGECDLQDQAFKYGNKHSRFNENKRAVVDKYMGPLISTHMNRCIHCSRCVRFLQDVAGIPELGTAGRGEAMEIQTYMQQAITSELSGNVIDLCPVGALTSKPYAFKGRPWELEHTKSIDVFDAMGSNIWIDSRGTEVMRILPSLNDEINEEWLSDKARFSYDALKNQRIDQPYIRRDGKLERSSWNEALEIIRHKMLNLSGDKMAAIVGTMVDCESMFMLQHLMNKLGCSKVTANQYGYKWSLESRGNYLFNTGIARLEEADLCLLIGADLRYAAPVLGARIGRLQRQGKLKIARIGPPDEQGFELTELGDNIQTLVDIMSGKHKFSQELRKFYKPVMIIGDMVYSREDGYKILELSQDIARKYNFINQNWNGYNILHNHASTVGAIELGLTYDVSEILKQCKDNSPSLLYLLGADEVCLDGITNSFIIYQGHHGDYSANYADVVLPGAAFAEKDGIYLNFEGRAQYARRSVPTLREASEDWKIIKYIADKISVDLPYSNLLEIRRALGEISCVFKEIDKLFPAELLKTRIKQKLKIDLPFKKGKANFYMNNAFTRSSFTMTECAKLKALES